MFLLGPAKKKSHEPDSASGGDGDSRVHNKHRFTKTIRQGLYRAKKAGAGILILNQENLAVAGLSKAKGALMRHKRNHLKQTIL